MSLVHVELCAASAAIALARLGAKPPAPIQGGKGLLAGAILARSGFSSRRPDLVVLNEPGEWGRTWSALFGGAWDEVAEVLAGAWGSEDARALFDRLRAAPPDRDPVLRAATHLFLQSRTYRAKEVQPKLDGSGWIVHGFDPEWRLAKTTGPGSHPRGWYNARPTIAAKLRALGRMDRPPVEVRIGDARGLAPIPGAEVVFDPPYHNSRVAYLYALPRPDVLVLAQRWAAAGGHVVVCEGEELPLLGWRHERIVTPRTRTQLARAGHEEWIAVNR